MRPFVGGLLVWLVPFGVSCFLIDPEDGSKVVTEETFRTVMLVVGSLTASCCTALCFDTLQSQTDGICVAALWLAINWGLDALVLVPLLVVNDGATPGQALTVEAYLAELPVWFQRTGLAYLVFVLNCVVVGRCVEQAAAAAKATADPEKKQN